MLYLTIGLGINESPPFRMVTKIKNNKLFQGLSGVLLLGTNGTLIQGKL